MSHSEVSTKDATHPSLIVGEAGIAHRGSRELDGAKHTDKCILKHATDQVSEVSGCPLRSYLRHLSALNHRIASQGRFHTHCRLSDHVKQEHALLIALSHRVSTQLVVLIQRLRTHNKGFV